MRGFASEINNFDGEAKKEAMRGQVMSRDKEDSSGDGSSDGWRSVHRNSETVTVTSSNGTET